MNNLEPSLENQSEKLLLPDILPEERPEEYLMRLTTLIYEDKYRNNEESGNLNSMFLDHVILDRGMNIHDYPKYQNYIKEALKKLITYEKSQKKKKFSEEKQFKILIDIKNLLTAATNRGYGNEEGHSPFLHTRKNRTFFGSAKGTDNIPYAHSLFNIGLETPDIKLYFKEKIKDKIIYLLGGGDSVVDIINSEEITPKQVINFDPFIDSETIDKARNKNYLSLPLLAQDFAGIKKEIESRHIELADEIWASYSVPYYLITPEEISGLFQTIKESLAENGTARITPIAIQGDDEELYIKTKQEFMNQIKIIMDSPEYNIYVTKGITGDTLFIEKIPKDIAEKIKS